jgi:N-acetylglucosaminyl-diphospho-decaprenol L-rhamnosyltransferase
VNANMTDTAAVIVTHRRADLARACVEAVACELDPASIVVVVNDPGAVPHSDLNWLSSHIGSTLLNSESRGYGANVNAGVRTLAGGYRYYVILNDDVLPAPGCISTLREALERTPTAALAGPRLTDRSGDLQATSFRFPSVASELASAIILPAKVQRWLWLRTVSGGISVSPVDADVWLLGAALMIRAAAFEQVNGFDERFFLYSEETDLAYRMKAHGWSSCACSEASAVHTGAQSTGNRRYRRLLGVSRWRYVRKHWTFPRRACLLALLSLAYLWNFAYVAARIALRPRSFRDKLALWAAHWDQRPVPQRSPLRKPLIGTPDG